MNKLIFILLIYSFNKKKLTLNIIQSKMYQILYKEKKYIILKYLNKQNVINFLFFC